jgi:Zn-dependent protease
VHSSPAGLPEQLPGVLQEELTIVNYSWKLGRLCGIDIFLHWSLLIVPSWVALTSLAAGAALASAVNATFFVFAVFGFVLLHELGHALMARRYGIATRDITLLPIGGLARLEEMPRQPEKELLIALAGPLMNLTIVLLLLAGQMIVGVKSAWVTLSPTNGSLVANLAGMNLVLAVFNLLPAFPMDGGRVLRALLAMWISYGRATQIAAGLGQAMAVLLAILGLMGNWGLLLAAMFVFVAARNEARMAAIQESAADEIAVPNESAALIMLPAHARADEEGRALFSPQYYFPVVQGSEVVGVLSKASLLRALARGQGDRLIAELMVQTREPASCVAYVGSKF